MPPEFRAERGAHAERVQRWLSRHGKVVFPGLVDSVEAGRAAGNRFADESVDVVIFVPTMAAPPSYAWEAVRGLTRVPVVAVGASEFDAVPRDYNTEQATRHSLPVGLVMFTNQLMRAGRPFLTVTGALGSAQIEQRLREVLTGVRGASALLSARLGAIGPAIEGYLDIEATGEDLQRLGPSAVEISREELNSAFAEVEPAAVETHCNGLRKRYECGLLSTSVLARSARLSLALQRLSDLHGLTGGAVNCHGALFRSNPDIGITACLGVSELSAAGRPFACTGDLPTAAALALGKAMAGTALYCELYALDLPGNWVLLANGGEGDIAACAPGTPVRLLPEEHYLGERGPGTAVAFALAPGPATLMSLSPVAGMKGGWVLVVASGELLGSQHETMEGPNGMFRFAGSEVSTAFQRWCEAGATHHAVLMLGDLGAALETAGLLLGIEVHRV